MSMPLTMPSERAVAERAAAMPLLSRGTAFITIAMLGEEKKAKPTPCTARTRPTAIGRIRRAKRASALTRGQRERSMMGSICRLSAQALAAGTAASCRPFLSRRGLRRGRLAHLRLERLELRPERVDHGAGLEIVLLPARDAPGIAYGLGARDAPL